MPLLRSLRRPLIIALSTLGIATTAGAQSRDSAGARAPVLPMSAIPKTVAGDALRAWFDAFNSGDSTRFEAFLHAYGSEQAGQAPMGFRRNTGGFDLISIVNSEPRHIEFAVRERNGPTTALGEIEVPAGPSPRLIGPSLAALGPNVPVSAAHIDAATRARVVDRAAVLLDSFYVFPDVARRMGDTARARFARGEYDRYTTGPSLARRLTDDLESVSHDKHLNVRFSGRVLPKLPPEGSTPPVRTPDEIARDKRDAEESNCGFDKAERLEGNIGYLEFDGFDDADLCAGTVAAAMNFLGGTRALIIDLRQNGGGQPKMVALVASYLFDTRTHLNDLFTRYTGKTDEFYTTDSLLGRRYGGTKPVYVLTSSRTFSGAEEFTYDLKSLKRATVVGETTGGGAHPVRPRAIDEHFFIGVPFAQAVNPVTHTNWEGTGVVPDVKVSADEALAAALRLAREGAKP